MRRQARYKLGAGNQAGAGALIPPGVRMLDNPNLQISENPHTLGGTLTPSYLSYPLSASGFEIR
jgi:hypothetical protein